MGVRVPLNLQKRSQISKVLKNRKEHGVRKDSGKNPEISQREPNRLQNMGLGKGRIQKEHLKPPEKNLKPRGESLLAPCGPQSLCQQPALASLSALGPELRLERSLRLQLTAWPCRRSSTSPSMSSGQRSPMGGGWWMENETGNLGPARRALRIHPSGKGRTSQQLCLTGPSFPRFPRSGSHSSVTLIRRGAA